MKVLVVGSRKIDDYELGGYIPNETSLIISGGACGVDTIAEKYADGHKISKLILRPQYCVYGKHAPLKRNEEMVELADKIIAVWDGVSRGTLYTINYAKKRGKNMIVINTKDGTVKAYP